MIHIKNMSEFVKNVVSKGLGGEGSGHHGHSGLDNVWGGSSSSGGGGALQKQAKKHKTAEELGVAVKEMPHSEFMKRFGGQMKKQGGGDYASGVYFKEADGKPTIWINKEWLDSQSAIPGVSREAMKSARVNHELGHHVYENVLTSGEKAQIKIPDAYKDSPKEFFSDVYVGWIKGKKESWMSNVPEILDNKFKAKV